MTTKVYGKLETLMFYSDMPNNKCRNITVRMRDIKQLLRREYVTLTNYSIGLILSYCKSIDEWQKIDYNNGLNCTIGKEDLEITLKGLWIVYISNLPIPVDHLLYDL